MKKFICLVVVVLLVGLAGCAPVKRINEKNMEVAKSAVEIIDSYVDGEATIKEAVDGLKGLEKEIDLFDDTAGLGVSADLVYSPMNLAMSEMNLKELGHRENHDELLKYRNKLAELADIKKR